MRRLHRQRMDLVIDDLPEILGDVFAWNKLFRASFWRDDRARLAGGRPLRGPADHHAGLPAGPPSGSCPEVVYHWRIRSDGSSITQQRSSLQDLRDRWSTKLTSLAVGRGVRRPEGHRDLPRPGAGRRPAPLLRRAPRLRGRVVGAAAHRRAVDLGIAVAHPLRPAPRDRLVGWLVEQGRRSEAEAVAAYARDLGRPLDRVDTPDGRRLDRAGRCARRRSVAPAALELRPTER